MSSERLREIRERLDSWHQKADSIASKKDRIDGDPILLAALLSGSLLIRKAASDIRWLLERVEELERKMAELLAPIDSPDPYTSLKQYIEFYKAGKRGDVEWGFTAKKSPSAVIRPECSND